MSPRYKILDSSGEHFATHTSATQAINDVYGPRFHGGFWIMVGKHKKKFTYQGATDMQVSELLRWAKSLRGVTC